MPTNTNTNPAPVAGNPVPVSPAPAKKPAGKPIAPDLLASAKPVAPRVSKRIATMIGRSAIGTLSDSELTTRVCEAIRATAAAEVRAMTTARVTLARSFELVAGYLLRESIAEPGRKFSQAILADVKKRASDEIVDKRPLTKGKGLAPIKGAQVIRMQRKMLWESVSTTTRTYCSRAAALLADPDSGVVIGYLPLTRGVVPPSLVDKIFQREEPKSGAYLAAICAPQNVLQPKEHRGTRAKPDAQGNYRAEMVISNPVDHLRPLDDAQLNTLYFHRFYDGDTAPALRFVETTKDPEWSPSGMLIPMSAAGVYPATTRVANVENKAKPETLMAKLSDNDPTKAIATIGQMVRSAPRPQWGSPKPVDMLAAILELATIALDRSCADNDWQLPSMRQSACAAALVDLTQTINGLCEVHKDGDAFVIGTTGSKFKLDPDRSSRPIIPAAKAVKPAASGKKPAAAA